MRPMSSVSHREAQQRSRVGWVERSDTHRCSREHSIPAYDQLSTQLHAWQHIFLHSNLSDRRNDLLIQHIDLLREAFRAVATAHPFTIDAIVVLPEHVHAIWALPPHDADYALRWRLIKTRFSRGLPNTEARSASRIAKRERGIWQRRYWGIKSATSTICKSMCTTSTSIPSSMGMWNGLRIGRIRRFNATSRKAIYRRIGRASWILPMSGNDTIDGDSLFWKGDDGHRFAQPILRKSRKRRN